MTSYPGRPGTRTACSALPNAESPAGTPATSCLGGRERHYRKLLVHPPGIVIARGSHAGLRGA
jgi:hypothetical protein